MLLRPEDLTLLLLRRKITRQSVDIASPWDHRVYEKEGEKIEKYQDLKREIGRLWGIRHREVIPVVIGALKVVSKRLDAWLEKLGVTIKMGPLQKTALLGTAEGEEMTQRTFAHWLWLAPLV